MIKNELYFGQDQDYGCVLGLSAELNFASCALLEAAVQNVWYLIRPESVIFFEFSRQNGASLRNYPDACHETSLPKVLHIFAAVRSSASIGQPQYALVNPWTTFTVVFFVRHTTAQGVSANAVFQCLKYVLECIGHVFSTNRELKVWDIMRKDI